MGQAQLTARRRQKHRWLQPPFSTAQPFVPGHGLLLFTVPHFFIISLHEKSLTVCFCDFGRLQPHQVWQLVDDDFSHSCSFVNPLNASSLPVSPVDVIPQESETKDMRQLVLQQSLSARPIHTDHLRHTGRRGDKNKLLALLWVNGSILKILSHH